ncbi:MAG: hypothetical protein ACXWNK_09755 [Vulcanimicrobiaceae bacterium]
MKRKKRRLGDLVVPRLGPPQNLRPAGAHESKKLYRRHKMKAVLRKEEDGFLICVRLV